METTGFNTDANGLWIEKDPQAVLDYTIDWSKWLQKVGDAIVTSVWDPVTGIAIQSQSYDTVKAIVWLTGGTLGATYTLTNRITTAGGRTEERSFRVVIANR